MSTAIDLDVLRKRRDIMKLQGREYIKYSGLLWVAHEGGLSGITTELVHADYAGGHFVFRATVTGSRGEYSAHGDASPDNVSGQIRKATLRMAETRAVARALRSYTGIGMTAWEELPGRDSAEQPPSRQAPGPRVVEAPPEPVEFEPAGPTEGGATPLRTRLKVLNNDKGLDVAALTKFLAGRGGLTVGKLPEERYQKLLEAADAGDLPAELYLKKQAGGGQ